MTREEMDFIGGMNMCDEISNEAYQKIMTHCEEQEPCEDCISRQALKQKLQERHDFFVNAYEDMPLNDKARVDEISICIAEVVNAPSVTPQPKIGWWIFDAFDEMLNKHYYCSECKSMGVDYWDFCPNCGAKMEAEE